MAYWPGYLRLIGWATWAGLLWLICLVLCRLLQAYCGLLAWLIVAYWSGYLRLTGQAYWPGLL